MIKKIETRPEASILSVLPHLNYEPWFALAEYVDNSVQSFLNNKHQLNNQDILEVRISINRASREILIVDDAAGINDKDLQRACQAASVPPDRSGLNEFGMGMKSASFWFARKWALITKSHQEDCIKTIEFDLDRIAEGETQIDVHRLPNHAGNHGTTIHLKNVVELCHGQTLGKIRKHLADIYRPMILEKTLRLMIGPENEEVLLEATPHEILLAPPYKKARRVENEEEKLWSKDISIEMPCGKKASGRAGIFKTGNSNAGISLYRRGRAVLGTGDTKWTPKEIYKFERSFIRQRLWVELNVDGFQVSHTKDGIKWANEEEANFISALKEQLEREPLNLIAQCEQYRARDAKLKAQSDSEADLTRAEEEAIQTATFTALDVFEAGISNSEQIDTTDSNPEFETVKKTKKGSIKNSEYREFTHEDRTWNIKYNIIDEPSDDMYKITTQLGVPGNYTVEANVYLGSPFFIREVRTQVAESMNVALSFIGGLISAEAEAALQNIGSVSYTRRHLNKAMNQ